MQWTKAEKTIGLEFNLAIERGQVNLVTEMLAAHPWLLRKKTESPLPDSWLEKPATKGNVEMAQLLIDRGVDLNILSGIEQSSVLTTAIGFGQYDVAKLFLKHGADPNISRPLISALNSRKSTKEQLAFVRLLVENKCDVNRLYDLYGDSTKQFTALDWTSDTEVIAYLKNAGAKTAAELGKAGDGADEYSDIIEFFTKTHGKVEKKSMIEVVPTGHPVAIHVIKPAADRKHLTLFTTGLSSAEMKLADKQAEFALAELFVQLPGDWPLMSGDPQWAWPIELLRKLAQLPHDEDAAIEAPVTIVSLESPDDYLNPHTKFTSVMLFAENSLKRADGKKVCLYRMVPLYSDERELELREGALALIRAFDRKSVPFVLDVNRESVCAK